MKRNKVFSLLATGIVLGLAACNNSSDNTGANADSTLAPATASTASSTNDYSAFADTVERNSQSGYYLNAKTGKPLHLKVDRTTGAVTDEQSGEPVWRYVDNRNWWVYGLDDSDWNWSSVGEAKMNNNELVYKGEGDKWISYDQQWKDADEKISKGWKTRIGDTKIKVGKDGDIKVKDEDGKVKYNADKDEIKTDSTKH